MGRAHRQRISRNQQYRHRHSPLESARSFRTDSLGIHVARHTCDSRRHGAQPEIITTGKNGLLIPPDDENALASAITGLAGNPGLRADLGKAGTETFNSRFAYNHFMTHILDIYGTYPQN